MKNWIDLCTAITGYDPSKEKDQMEFIDRESINEIEKDTPPEEAAR